MAICSGAQTATEHASLRTHPESFWSWGAHIRARDNSKSVVRPATVTLWRDVRHAAWFCVLIAYFCGPRETGLIQLLIIKRFCVTPPKNSFQSLAHAAVRDRARYNSLAKFAVIFNCSSANNTLWDFSHQNVCALARNLSPRHSFDLQWPVRERCLF